MLSCVAMQRYQPVFTQFRVASREGCLAAPLAGRLCLQQLMGERKPSSSSQVTTIGTRSNSNLICCLAGRISMPTTHCHATSISTTTLGSGPGMRLSIPLVDNGFVKTINNNVALGVGVDWAHYGTNSNVLWFPVVMQWNFFLTDVITVFGEPGGAIRSVSGNNHTDWHVDGVLQLGAKFMFSRNVGLTLRAGYPYFSLGLSVLM